jgi:hypothetical protein
MTDSIIGNSKNWLLHLTNIFRQLWEQHVMWTRSFIISMTDHLGDLPYVTQRLLRNPDDFAAAFSYFYGPGAAAELRRLLTEHLLIAADIVQAGIQGTPINDIQNMQKRFYQNADEIAAFLSGINPYWNEKIWRGMLYNHLGLVELEAGLRASGQYALNVDIFDEIEAQSLRMADYMVEGIIRQFRL